MTQFEDTTWECGRDWAFSIRTATAICFAFALGAASILVVWWFTGVR